MFQLKNVETKADWSAFIDLPWDIYKNDAHWVPPLKLSVRELLDVNKHPFFRHAFMHPLLVYQGDRCVGRAVGIVDENHNKFHEEKTAFFGFFESINDQQVVNMLLDEVSRWAKTKGMNKLRGPMNPSTNHECGLLVEGFDDPPSVMTTYNPSYYINLLEKWGLHKAKDMFAYEIVGASTQFSERLLAQAERLKKAGRVKFRPVNLKDFDQEVERLLDIYNDAWEKNWGFVPMDPTEFRHLASELKMVMDPELCLIAEVGGKPVGFGLTLPDVNQAFKKVKSGKLLPTGIFKLLWNMKGPGRKKTISRCRIITLGVKKNNMNDGIGPLLYTEYLKRAVALGYKRGEASWILEDNVPMNKALNRMAGERTKVYRIYDRSLN